MDEYFEFIDANKEDSNGRTFLFRAIENEDTKLVKKILKDKKPNLAWKTELGWNYLHSATMRNLKDIVELLLHEKININAITERGDSALHVACLNGFEEIARLLVSANADVNLIDNHETTPLMHAANGGHLGIVKLLLEHSADKTIEKNHNGYSAYTYAMQGGFKKMAELLYFTKTVDDDDD